MDQEIKIIEKEIGYVAEMGYEITMVKMASIFKKSYLKIASLLEENEIDTKLLIPYARYINVDWDAEIKKSKLKMFMEVFTKKYQIHIGIPIEKAVEEQGEVKIHLMTKTPYIQIMHYGSYHQIPQTYAKIMNWAQENGYEIKNESIEFYLNDPRQTPKDKLETEILVPFTIKGA